MAADPQVGFNDVRVAGQVAGDAAQGETAHLQLKGPVHERPTNSQHLSFAARPGGGNLRAALMQAGKNDKDVVATRGLVMQTVPPAGKPPRKRLFLVCSQLKIYPREVSAADTEITRYRIGDDVLLKAIPATHGMVPALSWRVEAKGCVITFSGDTSSTNQALEVLAQDSDFLIAHNAARENDPDRVVRFLHMVPSEIGRIAGVSKVGSLLLSHRMKQTLGHEEETTQAIRKNYPDPLLFADDLQRVPVIAH